jgi:NADP-dependent aldehyde dehydrogenase
MTSPTPTTDLDRESVLAAAASAAPVLAAIPPRVRAAALAAAADALDAAADSLVEVAQRETGLTEQRLRGELRRTTVQLRLFADVVVDGSFLDVRLDAADSAFALGPRPDLRRYLAPVGPVLNFAASNFPFAFSVAGGDTAAALAAGCPVVVKAHDGHLELSSMTAKIVAGALVAAGLPEGSLEVIIGREAGVAALKDERITAAAFTGSTKGGLHLAAIAAARPTPIPFFGELGSVNPVFVTPAAAQERGDDIAAELVASVGGSAGQLCTKSGFVFVPAGGLRDEIIRQAAATIPEHRLLYPGIAQGYLDRRGSILAGPTTQTIVEGAVREDGDGNAWVTPTFVRTDLEALRADRERLLDEAFGPLAILVEYSDAAALPGVVGELFPGNLTGSLHTAAGEDPSGYADLADALAAHSGRVVFNGWPTGVAVTPAMTHGGPFPATTGFGGTSVGTTSITRFLRPITYQSAPDAVLPAPLRDSNPWGVPQRHAPAGESTTWGDAAASGRVDA